MRLVCVGLALVGLAGCGLPSTPADAAVASDAVALGASPQPPAPPAPPAFGCPDGWRSVDAGATAICEPWQGDRAPRCARGELATVGSAADCATFADCSTSEWPELPGEDAVYVRIGATGGDGTSARPFGTIGEAAPVASAGNRPIALGEGVFAAEAVILRGVPALVGLCPARTAIAQADDAGQAALVISAVGAIGPTELRGVHISGAHRALSLLEGARAVLRDVWLEADHNALRVGTRAELEGERVRIDGPLVADAGNEFAALQLFQGSRTTLRRAFLTGGVEGTAAIRGYLGDAPSTLRIEDSAILDAPTVSDRHADITLRRVAVERSGPIVVLAGQHAELEDVRAREVRRAALAVAGGRATLQRVSIAELDGVAILVGLLDEAGAPHPGQLDATDLHVAHGTYPAAAIAASLDSSLALTRAVLADLPCAIHVQDSAATLRDVSLADLRAGGCGGGTEGHGIDAQRGALVVERLHARADPGAVVLLVDDDTSVSLEDVDVEGGRGLQLQCDPGLSCGDALRRRVARLRMRGASRFGLTALGASVTIEDVDVDGVAPVTDTRFAAVGVLAAFGGEIVGQRVRVRNVTGIGVLGLQDGTVRVDGLEVASTARLPECASCPEYFGDGLVCAEGGSLSLDRFDVHASARSGVAIAARCGPSHFARGTVHGNAIGVLSEGSSSAAARFVDVSVLDNDIPADNTDLALTPSDFGL